MNMNARNENGHTHEHGRAYKHEDEDENVNKNEQLREDGVGPFSRLREGSPLPSRSPGGPLDSGEASGVAFGLRKGSFSFSSPNPVSKGSNRLRIVSQRPRLCKKNKDDRHEHEDENE